jgi:hypothetical protein
MGVQGAAGGWTPSPAGRTLKGVRRALVLPVLVLLARDLGADVDVRVAQGRLDLKAKGAPLSEVLDRLARRTGMRVTYDGPPPRQPITTDIRGRTPAEVVLGLLEGLGLNYAIGLDRTGSQVETLFMFPGEGAPALGPPSTPAARPAFVPPSPPDDAGD